MARLVYLGTPQMAVPPLKALVGAGHEVALVISSPDVRRGRGSATSPSPVKAAALELGLEVTDDLSQVTEVGAELGVVVAYGRLIPAAALDLVPMVNLHFSLLPRWRGAAPVERALLAGDATTGVALMALEAGLDTGPVYDLCQVEIGSQNLAQLSAQLVELATELLVRHLAHGRASLPVPSPQVGEPTYAKKLTSADFRLDLNRPAVELERVVRLGRAFTTDGDRRLVILEATVVGDHHGAPGQLEGTTLGTGRGGLELVVVKPEGGRAMSGADWARGRRETGQLLGVGA